MKHSARRTNIWKWVGFSCLGLVVLGAGAVGVAAARYEPKAFYHADLGGLDFGGKTHAQVADMLDQWWARKQSVQVKFEQGKLTKALASKSIGELGVQLDKSAVLKQVPYDDFWSDLQDRILGITPDYKSDTYPVDPVYKTDQLTDLGLDDFIKQNQPPIQQARVTMTSAGIERQYESNGMEFDAAAYPQAVLEAVTNQTAIKIPIKEAPKHYTDADLDTIQTVVSQFATNFSAGNRPRSANIKLAASKINGTILLPGESFSFNDFLGKRTLAKGFKVAGVYVSGKHDIDVGGGICQVSTTLYNAVLLGELKVNSRSPHSLPVPYVPLGRDAAVSFPQPNLKFTNTYDTPIAISAEYQPGRLEFRILGEAPHHREIKFESTLVKTWSNGEKIVQDPTLKPGTRKVMDHGGMGRQVHTWKLIYEDGKLVEKVDMGLSTYRGGPAIIAVNSKPALPTTPGANPPMKTASNDEPVGEAVGTGGIR